MLITVSKPSWLLVRVPVEREVTVPRLPSAEITWVASEEAKVPDVGRETMKPAICSAWKS